jgi:hypothetical protein
LKGHGHLSTPQTWTVIQNWQQTVNWTSVKMFPVRRNDQAFAVNFVRFPGIARVPEDYDGDGVDDVLVVFNIRVARGPGKT